ncbi:hypothetical protein BofuT4_uP040400.1 [Botrytis cinerea T4]|uniref:Uncharacterized protein n=1 Tax=Botryotinia fuckeliana (strain T4) TaxID=999810 RepID=G2Y189_BOTF4|nr:hypothetical protein BofuT4_uP040400.1 [Botrytis cinerea T4]
MESDGKASSVTTPVASSATSRPMHSSAIQQTFLGSQQVQGPRWATRTWKGISDYTRVTLSTADSGTLSFSPL